MDVWIIYNERLKEKPNAFQWMKDAGVENGLNISVKFFERFEIRVDKGIKFFYDSEEITPPEYVLLRGYDIELAMALECSGVRVINSAQSMECSRDKWKSHLKLAMKKVRTPKSMRITKGKEGYEYISRVLGNPFVLKTIKGSKGEGVFLIESQEEFFKITGSLQEEEFICQEFIKESAGKDYRVHVIGNRVVAAIKRSSQKDFRSNYSLGGQAESVDISEERKELAVEAARALGLEIAGVDILEGEDGDYVCEVNGNAGFITVWKYSKISIPNEIMKYVSREMDCTS